MFRCEPSDVVDYTAAMQIKTKQVYYCEFCNKHGLSRYAIVQHESFCTMNPQRLCRWRTPSDHITAGAELALAMKERAPLKKDDIDWLHDEVEGCPACMLAALRQSGGEYHYLEDGYHWDYKEEVERSRDEEREMARNDQW